VLERRKLGHHPVTAALVAPHKWARVVYKNPDRQGLCYRPPAGGGHPVTVLLEEPHKWARMVNEKTFLNQTDRLGHHPVTVSLEAPHKWARVIN
jgi:hypothetical protein